MISRRRFLGGLVGILAVAPFTRHVVRLFKSRPGPLKPGLRMVPIKDIIVDPTLSCRPYPYDAKYLRILMDSIEKIGLMNPIVIDTDRVLQAGFCRIEACRRLGMTEIECQVYSVNSEASAWHRLLDNKVRHEFPLAAVLAVAPLRAKNEEHDFDDDFDDAVEDDEDELEDEDEDEDDDFEDEDEDDDFADEDDEE